MLRLPMLSTFFEGWCTSQSRRLLELVDKTRIDVLYLPDCWVQNWVSTRHVTASDNSLHNNNNKMHNTIHAEVIKHCKHYTHAAAHQFMTMNNLQQSFISHITVKQKSIHTLLFSVSETVA